MRIWVVYTVIAKESGELVSVPMEKGLQKWKTVDYFHRGFCPNKETATVAQYLKCF